MVKGKPFNKWTEVKLKYIHEGKSYRELAGQYKLSTTAIAERGKQKERVMLKEKYEMELEQELHEKLKNKRIRVLTEIIDIGDQLVTQAKKSLPALKNQVAKHPKIILDMLQQGTNMLINIFGINPQLVEEIRNKKNEQKPAYKDVTPQKVMTYLNDEILKLQSYRQRYEKLIVDEKEIDNMLFEESHQIQQNKPPLF